MRTVFRLLALLCGSVLIFSGAATPASANGLESDRFQVTERVVREHYEDVGRPGASSGDTDTFRDRLFHKGNRVGHEDGVCVVTRATKHKVVTYHCNVTYTFRGRGKVAVQGPYTIDFRRDTAVNVLPITGGTRHYQGATGSVRVTASRDHPTLNLFRLRG